MKSRKLFIITPVLLLLSSLFYFSSCHLSDIRTSSIKEQGITKTASQKGQQLMDAVWLAHGMEQARTFTTYEIVAEDHWAGLLGKIGKLWPDQRQNMRLRYIRGTFDAQVLFLDGKAKDQIAGLQSWQYYEQMPGKELTFLPKADPRITFGLAAFQYFTELPDRLHNVPTLLYAGTETVEGTNYELLFATWDQPEPTQDYDQYLLYVHPQTNLIDFASYSIRDNYLPGGKALYGTIRFADYREVQGVLIPFLQEVYVGGPGTLGDYAHRLTLSSFAFDTFEAAAMRPNAELSPQGDSKPL